MNNHWQDEIRSQLDAIGDGVHCQQAKFLAEYASQIVEQQLPDREQRLAWMVAEAKRRYFNLAFTIDSDRISYKWKQRRIKFTVVKDSDEAKALTMPKKYEFHPIANIFQMMPEAELAALASDIATNGLHRPIVLYQEKILDGRNRYLACLTTEVEPRFIPYDGDQPLQYVLSMNLKRRQLTSSQRATVAADLANLHREDTLKQNASDTQNCATVRISQSNAADMIGVSHRYVQEAVSLKKTEPQLYKKVQAGEISLQYALKQAHPRKYKRHASLVSSMKSATAEMDATKESETEESTERETEIAERFSSKLQQEFPEVTPEKVHEITEKVVAEWPEEPTTQNASDEIQRMPETYPEKLDAIGGPPKADLNDQAQTSSDVSPHESQATRQDSKNVVPELSEITGVLGGIRITLELTPQEFKILNQAVNPQCSDNEESAFAVGFVRSLKTRYQVIQRVR
jgi:hypothetical protein